MSIGLAPNGLSSRPKFGVAFDGSDPPKLGAAFPANPPAEA